ncbi:MAG: TetR/AcrR family transcriptional regulator [Solirubrobacteraceae bacterium]|nr:TetR/AcrR family transcriptional regulator [Solirubrobacteraceae bacterium]
MSARPTDPAPGRRERRKAETRGKLVDAARAVFARQGIEATRINEITDEADIGFGTFYNYFESKDAIVAAVMTEAIGAVGAAIDEATTELADPAEVVADAHRIVVRHVLSDPELGNLLVRLELSHNMVTDALQGYAARDIERGLEAGRFDIDDVPVALAATGGALLGVISAALRGRLSDDIGSRHAAGVLRLLGVPADEAAAIAARPLPPVAT